MLASRATNNTEAMTIGVSLVRTAATIRVPIPGMAKDTFDDDSAAELGSEIQANDSYNRQQGVPQRMLINDPEGAGTLGFGCSDVILSDDFKHGRTGHSDDCGHRSCCKSYGWHNKVLHRSNAGCRQQAKLQGKQHDQQQAQPECRHRSQNKSAKQTGRINESVLFYRRYHPPPVYRSGPKSPHPRK